MEARKMMQRKIVQEFCHSLITWLMLATELRKIRTYNVPECPRQINHGQGLHFKKTLKQYKQYFSSQAASLPDLFVTDIVKIVE